MHKLTKEFLTYRRSIKRKSQKRSKRKSFCGNPKNKGSRRMGTSYECLKRGYGASSNILISDLDKFFKHKF